MESEYIKSIKLDKFPNLENSKYHSMDDYISPSGLKKIKKSPAHFKYEPRHETEAMAFGSAYHTFILEPEKFDDEYYTIDDSVIYEKLIGEGSKSPRATNIYKEWAENEHRIAAGKTLIDSITMNTLIGMRDRLMKHPYAKKLLTDGEKEASYIGKLTNMYDKDINIRFRPDNVNAKKKIVVDLKTTKDASVKGFSKAAGELSYHISAAFYADMLELYDGSDSRYTFFFVAQEKVKPYAFNIFEASPQFISQGRYEYELLLDLYKYCTDEKRWPGYQVFCENRFGVNELNLPPWAINELDFFNHKY